MSRDRADERLVLAIDGGNSKVDLALATADGQLVAALRGPTISHQQMGLHAGIARLTELAGRLVANAGNLGSRQPDICVAALAGADFPEDTSTLRRAIEGLGLAREVVVVNDTFGALRAGSTAGWGVCLVCGQGINAAAIAPNGRRARFPGVGDISGDWGGGGGIAMAAIRAAARADDGRGPQTSLEASVPAFFGAKSPAALVRKFYFGRIEESRISSLAPLVFAEAAAGDEVARSIIDRLADELATMAVALIRRLRMTRLDVEVVLAGGVFRNDDATFYDRLDSGIRAAAQRARLIQLDAPPVAGALLLAMDELARRGSTEPLDDNVAAVLRAALREWDSRLIDA